MPAADIQCTVEEVAAHIRARTKTPTGAEAGTFTPAATEEDNQTRPTREQVEAIIVTAARQTLTRLGRTPCSDSLKEDAKGITALRAAMAVEAGYFPEQVRTDRSNFAQLKSMHDDDAKALAATIARTCPDDSGGGDDDGAAGQSPAHGFDSLPLVGRSTPAEW
jgi:hypothetical protein